MGTATTMSKDVITLVGELIEGIETLSRTVVNTTARVRALEAFSIQLVASASELPQLYPVISKAVDESFEHYRKLSEQIGETIQASADPSALDTLNALRRAAKRS